MTDVPVPKPLLEFSSDRLRIDIYPDRDVLGKAAALYVAEYLRSLLEEQESVRIVVGSAPSQDEFFDHLCSEEVRQKVEWRRVEVFHMDEYIGLPHNHPQNFRAYQREHFLSRVDVKTFHEIHGETLDVKTECKRLENLLRAKPIDLVCLGIGENGHLAFNDPPVDFDDPAWVKVVELDTVCRQQQVNDGCFPTIGDVPTHAITLSLRVFQEAKKLSGVVPAVSKAPAVVATVEGEISEWCPASLMRQHPDARLFLEPDSASQLARFTSYSSDSAS